MCGDVRLAGVMFGFTAVLGVTAVGNAVAPTAARVAVVVLALFGVIKTGCCCVCMACKYVWDALPSGEGKLCVTVGGVAW